MTSSVVISCSDDVHDHEARLLARQFKSRPREINEIKDASLSSNNITLVGHTAEQVMVLGKTIKDLLFGGKTPKEMADFFYEKSKDISKLEHINLIGGEAGLWKIKDGQKTCFAQKFADEMDKRGFKGSVHALTTPQDNKISGMTVSVSPSIKDDRLIQITTTLYTGPKSANRVSSTAIQSKNGSFIEELMRKESTFNQQTAACKVAKEYFYRQISLKNSDGKLAYDEKRIKLFKKSLKILEGKPHLNSEEIILELKKHATEDGNLRHEDNWSNSTFCQIIENGLKPELKKDTCILSTIDNTKAAGTTGEYRRRIGELKHKWSKEEGEFSKEGINHHETTITKSPTCRK